MPVLGAEGKTFQTRAQVLIIGAGACGTIAALAAKEHGAEAVILERDAKPSGSTSLSSGQIPAAGTRLQRAAGLMDDTPDLLYQDIFAKSHGECDHAIARVIADEAKNTVEWLVDRYQFTVRPDAPPGDYALIAGAYQADGTRLLLDGGAQDYFQLATLHVSPATQPPVTRNPVFRPFAAPALIGYDYDRSLPDSVRLYLHWRLGPALQSAAVWVGGSPFSDVSLPAGPGYLTTTVDLPPQAANLQVVAGRPRVPELIDANAYSLRNPAEDDRYVPLGGAMVLVGARYSWVSSRELVVDLDLLAAGPLTEDDIVKVDLVGPDYAWRAESDSVPAGGAIPTLKWVRGSLIHDRHRLFITAGSAPGLSDIQMAAYDHFTNRVLPTLDPRIALLGPTAPLAQVDVRP